MDFIKFNYCPILGLKNYEITGIKTKYLNSFYKSKSKYINTKEIRNFKI